MSQRIIKSLLVHVIQILILYTVCIWATEYKMEAKIVGGGYADIAKFPHAVYLSMVCEYNMLCGSSILNQIILLTAAHCLQCTQSKLIINAHAGDENYKQASVVRKARKFMTHPDYSDRTLENDIALILLEQNLPLGKTIKRVIIKTKFHERGTAYVAGWGITNDATGSGTIYLKSVKVTLHPRRDCSVIGYIFPGTFCAGTTESTRNRPSRGDSGSGLVTDDHQQLGIVSFRTEPYIAMLLYTNVSYYYTWIRKTAKQLYCSKRIK